MKNPEALLNKFFASQNRFFGREVPAIIGKTSVEYYKEAFTKKGFDGKPWPALSKRYKPKRGSMMIRSSKLINSIKETSRTASSVVISAGNSKTPYAKIHNEGGTINRAARSELFIRNRSPLKGGKGGNRFAKGTKSGKGLTFKASQVSMPQRQFMGYAFELNERIIRRIVAAAKTK
jgi:phage gpG-like protein